MVNLGEKHMDRRNQGFTAKSTRAAAPRFALFVGTALASFALAGCTAAAPPAEASFAKAQSALEAGKTDSAIGHAEAAVLADPRNAGFRAMLGAAYLDAGRFNSASQAFGEALELGDNDPRTVLSYALAKIATGDNKSALAKLAANERAIAPADLGLALALAGQPEKGVHYLVNSVRNGSGSSKARQNLAYAYALAGNWRAARVMAAEDVPADQLDARLSGWASTARPEDYQTRVAQLLGVTAVADNGQPQHLALANFPSQPMMVAQAEEQAKTAEVAAAEPSESEAMAFGVRDIDVAQVSAPQANPVPAQKASATATPTPAPTPRATMPAVAAAPARSAPRFVSNAVVQNVPAASRSAPARAAAPAPAPAAKAPRQARMAVATGSADTHRIQLGSFNTRKVAEAKWDEFTKRFPQLKGHDLVITEARVKGRTFYRLAAAGFGARSARSMCGTVKSSGRGCFAYAATNPPAGAVDNGVRIAARTR